ncbi:hypothetical protein [Streptomyces sp. NPDC126933]|uniref:hypothetical protein n=1 Tax=unclassified Streptomyces TaxID=2593676 RepID=UPI00366754D3
MTEQTTPPAEPTPAPAPTPTPAPEPTPVPAASAVPPPPEQPPAMPSAMPSSDNPWQAPPAGLPHAPLQPPLMPQQPRPPRRVLRAVARWTVAVLVCGGLGAGTAYGISAMERTDVPGLATQSDGRWEYPRLSLPALPAGSPRPFTEGNAAEIHHADLRELLLPAPAGATADKKLTGGWVSTDQYLSEYAEDRRSDLRQGLRDEAVRHIAARGWTMPDGTTSRVYLLRFQSVALAEDFKDRGILAGLTAGAPLAGAPTTELDESWPASSSGGVPETSTYVFTEPKPYGATQVRQAYVLAGDTLALVVHEKKGGASRVAFHQTLTLQNQLLG